MQGPSTLFPGLSLMGEGAGQILQCECPRGLPAMGVWGSRSMSFGAARMVGFDALWLVTAYLNELWR